MFDFLSSKFSTIFTALRGEKRLTQEVADQTLEGVKDALIEADVPYGVIQDFIAEIKKEIEGKKLIGSLRPQEQLMKIVHDKLVHFLSGGLPQRDTALAFDIPSTVMVMGLQGSGKTTTVAKLAHYLKENALKRGKERRLLVASVDFYRPAATEQLQMLAQKEGIDFYRAVESADPVKAALEIERYARAKQYEILLLDTAGRLHVDQAMLDELKKIDGLVKPKYKILVLDAMTGQESLAVARTFLTAIGFLGVILSKADSTARSGSAFAFGYVLKKPIICIGTGERPSDLELFRPERTAQRMLDMGDLLTLVETAESKITSDQQKKMERTLKKDTFTLQDFADHLGMVSKLGSLSSLIKYMPGAQSLALSPEAIDKGEEELKKFKAIIASMTPKERLVHKILDASRKKRIARGSGVSVADIDVLLNKFEQSRHFVKLFKRMGQG